MIKVAFSGPRSLTPEQEKLCRKHLSESDCRITWNLQNRIAVGDAKGVDKMVFDYYTEQRLRHKIDLYEVEGRQPWQFAARTQRMLDDGATHLLAMPNKPCPEECKPSTAFSGHGSGTWGAIAYAKKLSLEIWLYPLVANLTRPEWLDEQQLRLF